jgi:hypothetical protein
MRMENTIMSFPNNIILNCLILIVCIGLSKNIFDQIPELLT